MALDGIVIRAVVHELQQCVGGRINKIHQPTNNDIVMQLRAQGANHKLLLSANPTYPRVHLTQQQFVNPLEAPMFCMLLRKHCENGVIETVEQVGMERIIRMTIRQRDELGDIGVKTIVIEMMGRHSNIILIDPATGVILDGIHHVTPAISSYRVVMPGSLYVSPPEQGKLNPLHIKLDELESLLRDKIVAGLANESEQGPVKLDSLLVQSFSGMSPLVASELIHRSGAQRQITAEANDDRIREHVHGIARVFVTVMQAVSENRFEPTLIHDESTGKAVFSALALTHPRGETESFSSISACLEAFYGDKAERDTVKQRTSDLLRFLQNEKTKNIKKLDKLRETVEEAKDADKYRILGELLTASLHLIKRGDKQLETINYYDEEQRTVTIALDPLLTPSENAQRYFKRYTKSKNSLIVVGEQIQATHDEIAYLDSLLQQLDHASLSDIDEIRDELIGQGYIRDRAKKLRKKKKIDRPALHCFTSSEGVSIYVGKNNTQNEYVTNRLAQANDTWLHTKDIPGSHVVIRGTEFGDKTLEEAAQLAAYYSQAKTSSQVPVDYTLIRHVRKPNGAKPGFVIYDHQKTLFVTPDESLVKQLPVVVKQ